MPARDRRRPPGTSGADRACEPGPESRSGASRIGSAGACLRRSNRALRIFGASAAVDGRPQQSPRFRALAAIERRHAVVQQLFGLPLTLRERTARPFDVGAGTRMAAIEKQRPRPDVDRLVVVGRKVVIQAGEEQLLDFCVAIGVRRGFDRA